MFPRTLSSQRITAYGAGPRRGISNANDNVSNTVPDTFPASWVEDNTEALVAA